MLTEQSYCEYTIVRFRGLTLWSSYRVCYRSVSDFVFVFHVLQLMLGVNVDTLKLDHL